MSEPALWAWFLFDSGLPAQRAKELLLAWWDQGVTLEEALTVLPDGGKRLGLTRAESARLSPPAALPSVQALTWRDPYYPSGLHRLPLKLRPALLCYEGEPSLLGRPIIVLAPGEVADDRLDELREVINLLLDEDLLPAAYDGSDQAGVLMEEMAYSQGESLLFANAGISARTPTPLETNLLEKQRLLVVSPLPPDAPHRTAWDDVLTQVALAAADRLIFTGGATRQPRSPSELGDTPALILSSSPADTLAPPGTQVTDTPSDVLLWVASLLPDHLGSMPVAGHPKASGNEVIGLPEEDLGPAPTANEILATLGKGGRIPEALRRRIAGEG